MFSKDIRVEPKPNHIIENGCNYKKWFFTVLLVALIIKCLLAVYIPLTGDEAYFAVWGKHFQWGYYDHTPLIGWILYPLVRWSTSNFVLRLPAIFVTTFVGVGIYLFLKKQGTKKASLVSILFLISPLSLCGVLVTTDVPLIFFTFLSGVSLFYAIKNNDHLGYYFVAGICLGLAFFSKYFAVLLALSYVIYFLSIRKNKKRSLGVLLLFLGVLPFGLENIYWNYMHSWSNILFNVFTRNEGVQFNWHTIMLYLLGVFYVVTPPICYYFIKYFKRLVSKPSITGFGLFAFALIVPLVFFLGLSAVKSIGLHWVFSFVPFAYLLAFILLSEAELIRSIIFMSIFSGIHLALIVILLMMPVQSLKYLGLSGHRYSDAVFIFKHKEIRKKLKQYEQNFIIASPSYAKAVLMYIDSGYYSPTFGRGSVHGREGDFLTNFKEFKYKNFLIVETKRPNIEKYIPYFRNVFIKSIELFNAKYYLVFGYNFNYTVYRRNILRQIYQRYWQLPSFLPMQKNFYCTKYSIC